MREKQKLDSRAGLAALLSALISQLILLLPLLFPSSPLESPPFPSLIFPLINHLLSASEIASTLTLLSFSRKRKRTHFQDLDALEEDDDDESTPCQLDRVDSAIPRTPDSFKNFFRMDSSTFEWLCGLLEPLLDCRDPVDSPLNLPAESRLGIGLFRLATGSDHREISRRFRVSEYVVKFCVKQLCRVLCTNYRFWISFPNQNELDSVSTQFETLTGLPNCCGIIHTIRFKISRGNGSYSISKDIPQEETLSAQIVVDSSSRILSIAAGFRGDKDNFKVLKGSTLYKDINKSILLNSRTVHINDIAIPQYLVGDGGYPLLSWLIVPFFDPISGSNEENFNKAYSIMHLSMHRAIASLRNWEILSRPIEAEFKSAVAYVGACSILHNMLLMREDYSAFANELDDSTLYDQSFRRCRDNAGEEDIVVDNKASDIRSALATKARSSLQSDHLRDKGQLQQE